MINTNKILTVSYGTFSCTLEGFDDSFGTMKAIAEYFRDLSADDRYFGAEPAQPDAQMLARIAQREISRHVEAREDEGRIVLSAQDTSEAAAFVAADSVDDIVSVEADIDDAKVAQDVELEDTVEAEVIQEPVAQEAEEAIEEPVADVVEDISTEVQQDETPDQPIDEDVAEEMEADVADEPTIAVEEPIAKTDLIEQDIVPSLPDADVEAFFADSTTADEFDAVEDTWEATPTLDEEEPEVERVKASSIADKLKRIRAVVSQQPDVIDAPDYSEDQHAAPASIEAAIASETVAEVETVEVIEEQSDDVQNDVLTDTLHDIEDALEADDAIEVQEDLGTDLEVENDDISAILSRLDQEVDDEAPATVQDLDDDTDDLDDDILAEMDSIVAAPDADDFNFDDLGDENLFEEAEAEDEETVAPALRSRVLKVKRATLEAAIKAGKLEAYDDEEDESASEEPQEKISLRKTPQPISSSLSDAAEEELARDLAELEADIGAEDLNEIQDLAGEQPEAEVEPVAEEDVAYTAHPEIHAAAEDDLSRLMEETDSQMGEPEGATRRDAFAHLRAAVAAKKADEAIGGGLGKKDSDEAYRDDLANAVRPPSPDAADRNRVERAVPLKLVAEQRIDVADTPSVVTVRPRTVATVAETPAPTPEVAPVLAADASDFAIFAADVGAQKLPDLLEAAAAFLSFVEGHENFSRPQLMTKVRQVEKEDFTREESLRSFGKLLREGKIEKLKGGRFQASEQISFKQDARAAG
jgi:hypothetical protein